MDKSQPSISFHLRKLEESGLIIGWKKGKFTHYDIVKEQLKNYLTLVNKELS
jgi:DNA-binding transcriptional ArsR family regulator